MKLSLQAVPQYLQRNVAELTIPLRPPTLMKSRTRLFISQRAEKLAMAHRSILVGSTNLCMRFK